MLINEIIPNITSDTVFKFEEMPVNAVLIFKDYIVIILGVRKINLINKETYHIIKYDRYLLFKSGIDIHHSIDRFVGSMAYDVDYLEKTLLEVRELNDAGLLWIELLKEE